MANKNSRPRDTIKGHIKRVLSGERNKVNLIENDNSVVVVVVAWEYGMALWNLIFSLFLIVYNTLPLY